MRKYFSIHAALLCGMIWYGLVILPASAQTNPPTLRIVSSNNTATVLWPDTAYYFILQSSASVYPSSSWTNVASAALPVVSNSFPIPGGYPTLATNVIGNELAFSMPATETQKYFRLKTPWIIPLTSFAIFYNGTLEFSQTATMIVNGLVHATGPIHVGTVASLTFNQTVTTSDTISSPMADGVGPWTTNNWNTYFNGNPPTITNLTQPDLAQFIGAGTNDPHLLIEMPPAGENPNTFPGYNRLCNQAQMILVVTNDIGGSGNPIARLTLQTSFNGTLPANDPSPVILNYTNVSPGLLRTNLPFLSLTNLFYDQRERKTNLVTQIDIGRFAIWVATNIVVQSKLPAVTGLYPTIFYVADRRNINSNQLAVVRLINGAQLPNYNSFGPYNLGFSVVTMNPLYVLGNYNVQIATSAANASATTTNTTYTVPAGLVSDSLTVLSTHWTDAASFSAYSLANTAFYAVDDTINAAIVTGTVPSTDTNDTSFSGGVQNLPRLLENWNGRNLWLNTSFIRLWDSQMATNQFRNPDGFTPPPVNPYYNPPIRHYSFDQNFLNRPYIPPGIPVLYFGGN